MTRFFPASFFLLLIGMVRLPSASPSMVVEIPSGSEAPPETEEFFSTPITSIKAFTTIGLNSHYDEEFSSISHDAPLVFVAPADDSACPGCCKSFACPTDSPSHPLSPVASSLLAGRTVVLRTTDLQACFPTVNAITGYDRVHMVLSEAGVAAVILVYISVDPGW